MTFSNFHPAVESWFKQQFAAPSTVQEKAWPSIKQGRHTLLAAPTGSGKTLAAFLAVIDDLLQEGIKFGLPGETRVLYISPLKALSNDIQKNLQQPLMGIRDELMMRGLQDIDIKVAVRTGDTSQRERQRMRRKAPHILVTTPESLFILLTAKSGREMLRNVRSVIVDEIHSLAGNKRGAHLMLSLERLADLAKHPLTRIGISATQKPIETMASYLIGQANETCNIIDTGHARARDLAIEVTDSPLEALMSNEVWEEVYDRLAALCREHQTTLIFVNTRRLAERAAKHLAERLGEDEVTSHHGSLAKEHRLDAETRLKNGKLRALVATASLELGIDIGDVDLVCQLGSPGSIAVFLQRIGRSGHALHETPKGRLFPLSRDDLVEAAAILDAVHRGELDQICIPQAPLDILAQQIVAEVACEDWSENKLYRLVKRAWPYRNLSKKDYSRLVQMISEGYSTRRGRRGAYIHRDQINQRLRDRRGARLVAITNGGAIPDLFDYDVVLAPEGFTVGNLNEDFAFESLPGDIFQLGNTSYRILKVETGKVHVEDAHGMPPNIPFWFGEAPGRSDELSLAVSRLRQDIGQQLEKSEQQAVNWIQRIIKPGSLSAAEQLGNYLWVAKVSMDTLPTQKRVVFERFFDETGDMHFVIHSSFGSRINRAWGLALRKRFCRKFNFELQAAALEDSIILSLGVTHSFPLEEVKHYLNSKTVRHILIQALLDAPMFATHWRWNATIALAVQRNRNGKRVPPQFQRNDAEDLIAQIFPDQIACLENIAGEREVPDHPLVNQTLYDCLNDVMDIEGLETVLRHIESGEIEILTRDLTTPSVLAQEILNARPFAFLDDAPAEERRTLAVKSRRTMDISDIRNLSQLDLNAIEKIRQEAWPLIRCADELHDALLVYGFLSESELSIQDADKSNDLNNKLFLAELIQQSRATSLALTNGEKIIVAAERLGEFLCLIPGVKIEPNIAVFDADKNFSAETALQEIIRCRLQILGPVNTASLSHSINQKSEDMQLALTALEHQGFVMRGRYDADEEQWCERGLLARINRYTLNSRRKRVTSVPVTDYLRFLSNWHGLGNEQSRGPDALHGVLQLLAGYPLCADALTEALKARLADFQIDTLDTLCSSGRVVWFHPTFSESNSASNNSLSKTSIVILPREDITYWQKAGLVGCLEQQQLSSSAKQIHQYLVQYGASFFTDIVQGCNQLRSQVENALSELVSLGLVHSDNFAGLRALALAPSKRPSFSRFGNRMMSIQARVEDAGRWGLMQNLASQSPRLSNQELRLDYDTLEYFASLYLNRYGVIFKKLLDREPSAPSWRNLLPVLQRLEARGDLHGGRFVDGFSGIQFALPEVSATLKKLNNNPISNLVQITAADPLNLTGILLPGKRIPSHVTNKLVLNNGELLACQKGKELNYLKNPDEQTRWKIQNLLTRSVQIANKRFRLQ